MSAVLEAWLAAFLLFAGLGAGAVGVLSTGHLLRESWLAPVRVPLEAMAASLPLVALLALPVLVWPELIYAWAGPAPPALPPARAAWLAPWPFRLRAALILLGWILVARLLLRMERPPRWYAALALLAMLTGVTIAAQDWLLSRDALWWGSLQGFAVWIEGMMAALALAALCSLARGTMPDGASGAGEALERGLLALGLGVLWLWFTQFITVWMGDLPTEAAWYQRRAGGGWAWLMPGLAAPALLAGLALAAPPRHRPWRLALVCLLLLVAHGANLVWLLRPDAPLGRPPAWLDILVLVLVGAVWVGAVRVGAMRRAVARRDAAACGMRQG